MNDAEPPQNLFGDIPTSGGHCNCTVGCNSGHSKEIKKRGKKGSETPEWPLPSNRQATAMLTQTNFFAPAETVDDGSTSFVPHPFGGADCGAMRFSRQA